MTHEFLQNGRLQGKDGAWGGSIVSIGNSI